MATTARNHSDISILNLTNEQLYAFLTSMHTWRYIYIIKLKLVSFDLSKCSLNFVLKATNNTPITCIPIHSIPLLA